MKKFAPCYLCNTTQNETMPYGAGRKPICRECAMADNERLAIAEMYCTEAARKTFKNERVIEIPMSAVLEMMEKVAEEVAAEATDSPQYACTCKLCQQRRATHAKHAN